mmetsp:Transcript_110266/g.329713  ORF Transcript_110266/g.329713 Transcript_110266/m.329713 type:complete len:460 (+) Transcript_110266:99-1478(+)
MFQQRTQPQNQTQGRKHVLIGEGQAVLLLRLGDVTLALHYPLRGSAEALPARVCYEGAEAGCDDRQSVEDLKDARAKGGRVEREARGGVLVRVSPHAHADSQADCPNQRENSASDGGPHSRRDAELKGMERGVKSGAKSCTIAGENLVAGGEYLGMWQEGKRQNVKDCEHKRAKREDDGELFPGASGPEEQPGMKVTRNELWRDNLLQCPRALLLPDGEVDALRGWVVLAPQQSTHPRLPHIQVWLLRQLYLPWPRAPHPLRALLRSAGRSTVHGRLLPPRLHDPDVAGHRGHGRSGLPVARRVQRRRLAHVHDVDRQLPLGEHRVDIVTGSLGRVRVVLAPADCDVSCGQNDKLLEASKRQGDAGQPTGETGAVLAAACTHQQEELVELKHRHLRAHSNAAHAGPAALGCEEQKDDAHGEGTRCTHSVPCLRSHPLGRSPEVEGHQAGYSANLVRPQV